MNRLARQLGRATTSNAYRRLAAVHLSELGGFERIPESIRERWVQIGNLRLLQRGDLLTRTGAVCEALTLVIDGAFTVGRDLGSPRARILAILGPRDLVGIAPLVTGSACAYESVAREPSIVLAIPYEIVRANMLAYPGVIEGALALQLAHRTRTLSERLLDTSVRALSERLKGHLCCLAHVFGVPRGERVDLSLRVSQSELAQILGVSRQSVNAALRTLEDNGLVSVTRETIVMLNMSAMQEDACSVAPFTLVRASDSSAHCAP